MWYTNPDLTYQFARERQEQLLADHLKRNAARRPNTMSPLINALLERTGDLMLAWGISMRRRARLAASRRSNLLVN